MHESDKRCRIDRFPTQCERHMWGMLRPRTSKAGHVEIGRVASIAESWGPSVSKSQSYSRSDYRASLQTGLTPLSSMVARWKRVVIIDQGGNRDERIGATHTGRLTWGRFHSHRRVFLSKLGIRTLAAPPGSSKTPLASRSQAPLRLANRRMRQR